MDIQMPVEDPQEARRIAEYAVTSVFEQINETYGPGFEEIPRQNLIALYALFKSIDSPAPELVHDALAAKGVSQDEIEACAQFFNGMSLLINAVEDEALRIAVQNEIEKGEEE